MNAVRSSKIRRFINTNKSHAPAEALLLLRAFFVFFMRLSGHAFKRKMEDLRSAFVRKLHEKREVARSGFLPGTFRTRAGGI